MVPTTLLIDRVKGGCLLGQLVYMYTFPNVYVVCAGCRYDQGGPNFMVHLFLKRLGNITPYTLCGALSLVECLSVSVTMITISPYVSGFQKSAHFTQNAKI